MVCGKESVFWSQLFLAGDLDSPRRCAMEPLSSHFSRKKNDYLYEVEINALLFSIGNHHFTVIVIINIITRPVFPSFPRQHQSPWYDLRGWLDVKSQLSIYLNTWGKPICAPPWLTEVSPVLPKLEQFQCLSDWHDGPVPSVQLPGNVYRAFFCASLVQAKGR